MPARVESREPRAESRARRRSGAACRLSAMGCTVPTEPPFSLLPSPLSPRREEKGDSPHLCAAPSGPFRQMGTVPFFLPTGLSLLEVLVSMGILSVGLLFVAALIPIGALSVRETIKSDRTGACGRAALHEAKVRRMLDYNLWAKDTSGTRVLPTDTLAALPAPQIFAIDPLGFATGPSAIGGLTGPLGGPGSTIPRYTLLRLPPPAQPTAGGLSSLLSLPEADRIFRWSDELSFDTPATLSQRPRRIVRDNTAPAHVGPYPAIVPPETAFGPTVTPMDAGSFTWFLTVTPAAVEATLPASQRRLYSVSAVVCYQRVFSQQTPGTPDGEHNLTVTSFAGGGYGGGTIIVNNNVAFHRRGSEREPVGVALGRQSMLLVPNRGRRVAFRRERYQREPT